MQDKAVMLYHKVLFIVFIPPKRDQQLIVWTKMDEVQIINILLPVCKVNISYHLTDGVYSLKIEYGKLKVRYVNLFNQKHIFESHSPSNAARL